MNVNNSFVIKHALAFNAFFVLNYLAWLIGFQSIAPVIFTGLLIYFCYFAVDSFKFKHALPLLVILYLGLLSLGTVATSWDARSIWLFHAKRIFIDNSIFAQLDDYAIWSHNDYPVIAPLLSASFAKLIGFWNEIFPKASNVFFILPPLLIFYGHINNNRLFTLMVIGIFYIIAKLLLNGYMDGILALYALSTLIIAKYYFYDKQNVGLLFILQSIVLVNIKIEGFFIFAVIIASIFLTKPHITYANLKRYIICLVPIIFWALWKFIVHAHGVVNYIYGGLATNNLISLLDHVKSRFQPDSLLMIFEHTLLFKYYLLLALPLLFYRKIVNVQLDQIIKASLLFFALYWLFLFTVYVLTPHDLYWHLKGSATRTTLPLQLISLWIPILILKNYLSHKG